MEETRVSVNDAQWKLFSFLNIKTVGHRRSEAVCKPEELTADQASEGEQSIKAGFILK